jgi:uncharacterized protein with ParB-like and HNH nuclease domain
MSFYPPLSLSDVIDRIDYNQYLLPAIQRDFVWPSTKIEMLFDSLMQGYPIGSMLFWKVNRIHAENQRFYGILKKYRERFLIRSEEKSTINIPNFEVVLDGQQRLTALYLGLKGSYAYKEHYLPWDNCERSIPTRHLYLKLSYKNTDGNELNDSDDDRKYEFSFLKPSEVENAEKDVHWFKVGDILGIKGTSQLNTYFKNHNIIENEAQEILCRLHDIVHVERLIHYYLEENSDYTRALDIFIRINSGGMTLSYSDLIMSTTIMGWTTLDAKKEINGLVDELVKKHDYQVNKDFILRSYLILYNDNIKFRVQNFNLRNAQDFEKHWDEIKLAIKEVFQLVTDFGYNNYTLTSLNALHPILYYLYKTGKVKDFCKKVAYKEDRKTIKKWLHVVLLRQIFGGQAEGILKVIRDTIKEEILKDGSLFPAGAIAERLSKTTKSITVNEEFIDNLLYTNKDNRYAFPVLAILFPHLDYINRDFHLDHCHPISVFNEKKLKAKGIALNDENRAYFTDRNYFDTIVNLQMLDGNDNKSKGAHDLKTWVTEYAIDLKKHYLPQELDLIDFPTFVKKRTELLKKVLFEELKF